MGPHGRVSAGNAAGLNDGATAALLADEETARELGLPVRMRLVSYAFVGVTTETLTPALAKHFGYSVDHGAVIATVQQGSPAAHAGLRGGGRDKSYLGLEFKDGGDVIVALAGHPVRSSEDVVRIVTDAVSPGQQVRVTLVRQGKQLQLPIRLSERPASP